MLQYLLNDVRVLNGRNDRNRPTTPFTLLYINRKDTFESLRPSERGPVSSRPSVSGFLVLLRVSEEQRLYAVCYWARTPHGILLDSPVVWVPALPGAP